MLKIGVTGGIGSGKTTVCQVFELLGVPVFYADTVAKSIMHTDLILRKGLIDTFGEASYTKKGKLNRPYISSIVFKNEVLLEKLNALVHPAVFRAFDLWAAGHAKDPYIIKEAALLYESEAYKMCDQTVLVLSPEAIRIKRIQARDGMSREDILLRMKRQFSDEKKKELADHILLNDEQQLLIPQILALHQLFLDTGTSDDH